MQQVLLLLQIDDDLRDVRILDVADLLLRLQLHVLNLLGDGL